MELCDVLSKPPSRTSASPPTRSSGRPPVAALRDIRLADGPVQLFEGVDVSLEPRARAALVGRNGAGKSTLMRILTGDISADSGDRFLQPGMRVVYVPQEPVIKGDTLLDHCVAGGAADWEARAWLSTFELDADNHDRAFLNRVTDTCFWLAHRRVRTLDQGFVAFEAFAERVEAEEAESARRLAKAIERETHTFYSSITARRTRNEGRARSLEALRAQRAELLRDRTRGMELVLDQGGLSGKRVAEAKGLAPDHGDVTLGTGLLTTYLDQARAELSETDTLWDALAPTGGDQVMVRGRPVHVAGFAKSFLFKESQLRQPVASLSGGERNRLLLARALTRAANLLVLDEPTNDLDMETLDLLEEMLAEYEGTLILVSHDRDFVDRLATSTLGLNGRGQAAESPGGWTDFIREHPDFFSRKAPANPSKAPTAPAAAPVAKRPAPKLSFKDQRRLDEAAGEMERLPTQIADLEQKLADPALYTREPKRFEALTRELDEIRQRLLKAEEDWLAIEERREALA
eukprot:gene15132-15275_t